MAGAVLVEDLSLINAQFRQGHIFYLKEGGGGLFGRPSPSTPCSGLKKIKWGRRQMVSSEEIEFSLGGGGGS